MQKLPVTILDRLRGSLICFCMVFWWVSENNNKKNKSQNYFLAAGFSCGQRLCKTSIQKTMALAIKYIS